MHFQDRRPPHEIVFELEHDLATLFRPEFDGRHLVFHAAKQSPGAVYNLELHFQVALPRANVYTLRVTATGDRRETSEGWFKFWTRNYTSTFPPDPSAGSADLYRTLAGHALAAETHLTDIAAVQQEILNRMSRGARFLTSHKEGGTTITLRGSQFVRADYGDWEKTETYDQPQQFFAFLRQFYDWETQSAPDEVGRWKLILRQLRAA